MTQALVLGTIQGLSIGLLAAGIVLVYRANKFINLAHAQLGAISAVFLAKLVIDWHVSWWLGFPAVVALGAGVGLGIERVVIRPLRNRSASAQTLLLASIGVTQLLLSMAFVSALKPRGNVLSAKAYPLPFDARVHFGGLVLNADSLLIIALAPAMLLGLGAFLRYSLMGKMIRGAASNPDAARLCGISINRVSAVTWGFVGALSAVTAVLLAPAQSNLEAAQLGPDLLFRTLGAAAVGGFVSIPAAAAGGVGLGIVEALARHVTKSGADATLVVFCTVLVVFVARAKVINRGAGLDLSVAPEQRPARIPALMADHPIVRHRRVLIGLAGMAVGLVLPLLPFFHSDAHRFQLTLILAYALVGAALTILVGWAGQVSLGHFALVGGGAFITARLAPHDWSLLSLLVISGLAGAAAMALTGLPAVRLRGLALAVTSLGVAVVAPTWLFQQDWFGSSRPYGLTVQPSGIANGLGRPFETGEVYYFGLAVLALALLAAALLRDSVPGRIVRAVRDNERVAASFSITPATVKLAALALSGFVAGAAGVIWAEAMRNVAAAQFGPAESLSILAVPVIGGLGSIAGAVVAAAFVFAPAFFLTGLTKAIFGELSGQVAFQLAFGGLSLLIVVLSYPAGLAGAAQRLWEQVLERMATRRASKVVAAPQPPLVVTDVHLSFGGIKALGGASIRVDEGEIVGLIGSNGAGKTTLLNAISGAIRPDAGSVRVFGEEVADLPAEFRGAFGVARSFQDARLFPGLTVLETVQVALNGGNRVGLLASALAAPWARSLNGRTHAEAMELLERFELAPWAHTLTADLSTGTRRICDLVAQLARRPKLLLLDEPTAGVAQRECEMFPPLLLRIRDELDCSILVIEHDMPMLMRLCDRIYALELGQVIAEGSPEEIRQDPRVIASYLGSNAAAINRSSGPKKKSPARRRARTAPVEGAHQ
jgi:ABC-type branched-subunit amino acid transport system ATPase component/ABC-type branched-subunit amino acid transport system permease subunit